jgi:uncharacterized protein YggE
VRVQGTRSGTRRNRGSSSSALECDRGRGRWLLWFSLAPAVFLLSLTVTGCGGDLSASAASAPSLGPTSSGVGVAKTVSVDGQATVTASPDEAVIMLTVANDAPTAPGAMDATSFQSRQMLDRLKAASVPDSAIHTSSITLYPVRTYDPDTGKETLTGYRAQNTIEVTLNDAPTVGRVLAAGVETGATLISGPDWRLRNDSEAVNEALQQAVRNARSKAETLAAAEGAVLGEVLVINEGSTQTPAPPIYSAAGAADSSEVAQPPVSSGSLDVTANVSVTYSLKP